MRKGSYYSEDEMPAINLTPLIDVVFVILIMFILIAPMLEMDQIQLADSAPSSKEMSLLQKEESAISIHVDQNNKLSINSKIIPEEMWIKHFVVLKNAYPKTKPLLFHDKRAQFGTYQKVKAALEKAGFTELDIVLGQESNK